ncbi:MAG: NUDIX hydrolase [Candidatus Micrarchaeota archaeon]|nr:NUDIX hydrolase [Candidatus Micrarchaeota archaeon]
MERVQELNAYLVLKKGDLVLALKRKSGIWEFPGGGVEFGENPGDAAIRECKEETGIEVGDAKFIGITSAVFESGGNEKHAVYVVYLAEVGDKFVKISGEHEEYRWVNSYELSRMKLGLNAEPILKML